MEKNLTEVCQYALKDYPMMSQSEAEDPIVKVIFTQVNGWKYFLYEYDAEQNIAFGYVMGDFSEFGSIDIQEQIDVANMYGHRLVPGVVHQKLSSISDFNS